MQNTLYRKYQQVLNKKKLDAGGLVTNSNVPFTGLGQMGVGLVDDFSRPDQYGYSKGGATVAKSVIKDTALGAEVGSVIPGVGTAIGAGVGATAGLVSGLISAKNDKSNERQMFNNMRIQNQIQGTQQSNALLGADPSLRTGNVGANYFKDGGTIAENLIGSKFVKLSGEHVPGNGYNPGDRSPLNDFITSGGKAKRLSSDNAEIIGKSHAQGGVQVPGLNSEVEGGETTKDNFVFSKALGFADIHRPIAKAKGVIEKKVQTKERVNSMRRLMEREDNLAQTQEAYKQANGIQ